jgi:hypothetical protein
MAVSGLNDLDNMAGVGSRLGTNNTAGVGSRMNVHVSGAGGAGNPGIFGANGTTAIIGTIGTNGGTGASWMWQDSSAQSPMRYEHPIQGQMLMVSFTASDILMFNTPESVWKQEIKKRLAMDLAEKMLEEGVIEFTQMQDSASGHKTIKARCYLVPDNQVSIIRTLYKK